MKLHTTRSKPDWQYESGGDLTRWQEIAHATRGIITPGNLISVGGLVLVMYGAFLLYHGDTAHGLLFVLFGRLMDLLDGLAAEATKTKSRLGEIVDTTCDKISILVTAIAAYTTELLPLVLLIILFLHHTYTALYSILFAQRYRIHTTRLGKYTMFVSWVTIIITIYSNVVNNPAVDIAVITVTIAYAVGALATCISYYRLLRRKMTERMRAAQWTRDIAAIIYVYNPRATNYKRAQRWIQKITSRTKLSRTDILVADMDKHMISSIQKYTVSNKKVLVAVAGGDGTVSSVANLLLKSNDKQILQNCLFLPLWGGNANDFAYMLNGLSSNSTPYRLLAQSTPTEIPTIAIVMTHKTVKDQVYACCYASFGATAFATRALDKKRVAGNKLIRNFPLIIIAREMLAVIKALRDAPMFRAQHENKVSELYEHTFINGSRIAKVNRIPLSLSEPAFFHAAIDRKHPSYLIEILRIITKRTRKQYLKRQTVTFTVHDKIDAQIDGEIYPVKAGTKVTINVNAQTLKCISTKL